jgi:hypothetical protein
MSWKVDESTKRSPPYETWQGRFGPRADLFLLRNRDASFEVKFEARNRLKELITKAKPTLVGEIDEFMTADDSMAMIIAEVLLGAIESTK